MYSVRAKFIIPGIVLGLAVVLGACSGTLPAELSAELPTSAEIEFDDGVEEIEFSGVIQEMSADTWTVAGISFFITDSTEIQPGLELGDDVKVHAQLNSADELTAREIEASELKDMESVDDDDDLDDEIEFTGTVDSTGNNSWVIGGTTVAVTSDTEIKGALSLGDLAKVHASMVNGVLTAREIEPAEADDLDDDDDYDDEFVGTVDSMGTDLWVIGGTTVAVTSDTEIKGALSLGDLAKVHASMVNGVLTAREIEPAEADDLDDDDDYDDEFVGTVEAITDGSWTVSGRTFTVTAETEIEGDIQIGDVVEVELEADDDGNVYAEEIELADDDDMDDMNDDDDDDDDDHDDDDEYDDDDDDDDEEDDDDDEEGEY